MPPLPHALWRPNMPSDGNATRACADDNACGTTVNRPAVTAALPSFNLPYFQCQVQPVFAKSCGMVGCHGSLDPLQRPFRVFSRARQRNDEVITINVAGFGCNQSGNRTYNINHVGTGTASCDAKARLSAQEWAISFDSARALSIGITNIDQNELLTQPLKGHASAHSQIKMWKATDTDYVTVRNWLNGSTAAANCNSTTNN